MLDLAYDHDLQQVFDAARTLADEGEGALNTAHLLAALLESDTTPRYMLAHRGLTRADALEELNALNGSEQPDRVERISRRCRQLAESCGAEAANTLHLLVSLCSDRGTLACALLREAGVEPASLRTIATALLTSGPKQQAAAIAAIRARGQGANKNALGREKSPSASRPGPAAERRVAQLHPGIDPRITRSRDQFRPTVVDTSIDVAKLKLDEDSYPMLCALGRNLSLAAAEQRLEPLVGRRPLITKVLDILGKRRANNPCLIGEPGVGKTALVEGLAYLQVHQPEAVPLLHNRILVELNMGALLSGTQLRGAFSERMATLRSEIEAAKGQVIVFFDEIHTLVGAGSAGDGSPDALVELSAAMAQGRFPCIGATTTENFRTYIEGNPAFSRRLEPIIVGEPSTEETIEILEGVLPAYRSHHEIDYSEEALETAVALSSRYLVDRQLPDKALALLDLAGSRSRRLGRRVVGREEVSELVSEIADIPLERLLLSDTQRLLDMSDFLGQRVIGHRAIIERVCEVVRRNYAGFRSNRPIGSFLFLGPTGVGKTELVKALADFLFQNREAICRFDMSEFMEPHSVARLIGSPPGYIGHDHGGQLTEAIRRRPYQIILFDEVEKAHPDVLQILLQLLDEGRLTDGRGRTVDFSNTLVVMTSNLGSEHYRGAARAPIGFGDQPANDSRREKVLASAKSAFPLELYNRIEERLVFEPLTRTEIFDIARLLLADSSRRLAKERGIVYQASDQVIDYLIQRGGFDAQLGARPMRSTISRLIEAALARQILAGQIRADDYVELEMDCQQQLLLRPRRDRPAAQAIA
ncbi:MAG: ATP-dependent Clp protease ATP-binding subunit [Deltaproteobacteria bacterium]|nr:ATP-dependent Clp protease ATP-binding subunit [Deltaproteobacteria bacterium]